MNEFDRVFFAPDDLDIDLEIMQDNYEELKAKYDKTEIKNLFLRAENRMLEDYLVDHDLVVPESEKSLWYGTCGDDLQVMKQKKADVFLQLKRNSLELAKRNRKNIKEAEEHAQEKVNFVQSRIKILTGRIQDAEVENRRLRFENRVLEDHILEHELPLPKPEKSLWYGDCQGRLELMQKKKRKEYRALKSCGR